MFLSSVFQACRQSEKVADEPICNPGQIYFPWEVDRKQETTQNESQRSKTYSWYQLQIQSCTWFSVLDYYM